MAKDWWAGAGWCGIWNKDYGACGVLLWICTLNYCNHFELENVWILWISKIRHEHVSWRVLSTGKRNFWPQNKLISQISQSIFGKFLLSHADSGTLRKIYNLKYDFVAVKIWQWTFGIKSDGYIFQLGQ